MAAQVPTARPARNARSPTSRGTASSTSYNRRAAGSSGSCGGGHRPPVAGLAGSVERAAMGRGSDADGAAGQDVEPEPRQPATQLLGQLHAATAGGARTDDSDRAPAGAPGARHP